MEVADIRLRGLSDRRLHSPRRHDVGRHADLCHVDGKPAVHALQSCLGRAVGKAVRGSALGADRTDRDQSTAFVSDHTPRGWLTMTGNLVRGEQHLYLQQPAYGTSYLIGNDPSQWHTNIEQADVETSI